MQKIIRIETFWYWFAREVTQTCFNVTHLGNDEFWTTYLPLPGLLVMVCCIFFIFYTAARNRSGPARPGRALGPGPGLVCACVWATVSPCTPTGGGGHWGVYSGQNASRHTGLWAMATQKASSQLLPISSDFTRKIRWANGPNVGIQSQERSESAFVVLICRPAPLQPLKRKQATVWYYRCWRLILKYLHPLFSLGDLSVQKVSHFALAV